MPAAQVIGPALEDAFDPLSAAVRPSARADLLRRLGRAGDAVAQLPDDPPPPRLEAMWHRDAGRARRARVAWAEDWPPEPVLRGVGGGLPPGEPYVGGVRTDLMALELPTVLFEA